MVAAAGAKTLDSAMRGRKTMAHLQACTLQNHLLLPHLHAYMALFSDGGEDISSVPWRRKLVRWPSPSLSFCMRTADRLAYAARCPQALACLAAACARQRRGAISGGDGCRPAGGMAILAVQPSSPAWRTASSARKPGLFEAIPSARNLFPTILSSSGVPQSGLKGGETYRYEEIGIWRG